MDLKYPSSISCDDHRPRSVDSYTIFDDKGLGAWSRGRGLGCFQRSFCISLVSWGQTLRSL